MGQITKIAKQKTRDRVNIYVDGKYTLSASIEIATKHELKRGEELTVDTIANLKNEDIDSKTYNNLLNFALRRPHSEKEIKLWFLKKKVLEKDQEELFNRLKKLDIIDDKAFAKWWIEQRTTFKSFSKRYIENELRSKGVARHVIEEAFLETTTPSEKSLAKKLLQKKFGDLETQDLKRKKRATDFLLRRGFSWGVIREILTDTETEE